MSENRFADAREDRLQLFHPEGFGQDDAFDRRDKGVRILIPAVPRHEDEPLAKLRPDSLDGAVEHIAGERGHHHVAEDHREFSAHQFAHAVHAIRCRHHRVAALAQEIPDRLAKGRVVLDQQHPFDGHRRGQPGIRPERAAREGVFDWECKAGGHR